MHVYPMASLPTGVLLPAAAMFVILSILVLASMRKASFVDGPWQVVRSAVEGRRSALCDLCSQGTPSPRLPRTGP